jgi:hypothetical protein
MNVSNLLATPLMDKAEVIAGEQGLLNEVTWSVRDTDLQFENWIMPGLLIVYTGAYRSADEWEAFLSRAQKESIAGVVAFPLPNSSSAKLEDTVDQSILDLHDKLGLPFIFIGRKTSVLSFLKRFASTANIWFNLESRTEHWLEELCLGSQYSGAESIAVSNGYNPNYSYYAAVLSFKNHSDEPASDRQEIERRMARSFLVRELSFKDAFVLSFELGKDAVVFIPHAADEPRGIFRERVEKAIRKPHGEVSPYKWNIAVGTKATRVDQFHESFVNAQKTQTVIKKLKVNDHICYYRDWYMHMLLLDQPKEQLEEQMRHSLEPVLDNPELMTTLTNYLVFGESLKTTSEKTFIHVNTLKYRLSRISELLCCDLKDPNVRFRLRMAITMYRYLNDEVAS